MFVVAKHARWLLPTLLSGEILAYFGRYFFVFDVPIDTSVFNIVYFPVNILNIFFYIFFFQHRNTLLPRFFMLLKVAVGVRTQDYIRVCVMANVLDTPSLISIHQSFDLKGIYFFLFFFFSFAFPLLFVIVFFFFFF